jgi:hypothetical protein
MGGKGPGGGMTQTGCVWVQSMQVKNKYEWPPRLNNLTIAISFMQGDAVNLSA